MTFALSLRSLPSDEGFLAVCALRVGESVASAGLHEVWDGAVNPQESAGNPQVAPGPDWDAVALHAASAVRAEVLILSCTDGVSGADIVGAVIRDARKWCREGIDSYLKKGP